MTVAQQKKILAEKLSKTTDKKILKELNDVFDNHENDWWDTLPDEVRKSVEIGLEQSKKGEVIPHDEVMKDIRKWQKEYTGQRKQK